MDNNEGILHTLKHGSKEEIGKTIISLARLKDPASINALREIMNSDDPYLSVMAAYALGETGDLSAIQYLEKLFRDSSNIFTPFQKSYDLKILNEVLKFPDVIDNALDLYNSSYFVESKEKLHKIMEIYSMNPPKMNIPYFDDLVVFSMKKTKGLILDALASSEFHLGNINQALQYSLEAITLAQEVADPQLLKIAYADLGYMHMSMGNYYQALELIHESLDIDKKSHDPWRKKNQVLSILSQLYYLVGQYEKAMEHIQEAIELSEKENDIRGQARCLNMKGVILCNLNESEDAEKCFLDALLLASEALNDKTLQGLILNNLSYVYYSLSEFEKAKEHLEKALKLSVQMSDKSTEGYVMMSMAILELESGHVEEARRLAKMALNIGRKMHNPSVQTDANFILGTIEDYYLDNPDTAYNYYKESITLSETLRKNLMLDDFKISFAENYINVYQQLVLLCIRTGNIKDAFEYIEKSKSRALVDMLCPAMNEIGAKKVTNEVLEEVSNLKGKLNFLRKKLNSALSSLSNETTDASDNRQPEIDTAILEEITELERIYKKTYEELKMKDPQWASLSSVDVTELNTVQNILDKDTLFLEFYQTYNEVIALSIRKDKPPTVFRLPVDIEKESERLYGLFSAMSEGVGIDTRSHDFIKYIKQPLSHFYNLLISPLITELNGINHVIISPHFFWHYLPFHALYDNEAKQYLIDKFSISYAPSASVLNFCMKKHPNLYNNALILANPTKDLPFAEEEAEKVKTKFDNNSNLFKGLDASLDKLSTHNQSDIIHLACHGYFRGDDPLFSHVILSDAEGNGTPCFLPDIFNLKLKTALVTLSACETGLSQFTTGDELIGMSRAFFYAGTSSLLSSLWTVNDKSTSLLMDRFYNSLVNEGNSKVMALKSAMQELKAMPEYSHPYFWAPFFLSGDWR